RDGQTDLAERPLEEDRLVPDRELAGSARRGARDRLDDTGGQGRQDAALNLSGELFAFAQAAVAGGLLGTLGGRYGEQMVGVERIAAERRIGELKRQLLGADRAGGEGARYAY